ncbi:MAG: HD domain-containing phosphohydrolase [Solirubrobacteraceae bacterium]
MARVLTWLLVAAFAVLTVELVVPVAPAGVHRLSELYLSDVLLFGAALLCGWRAVAIRRERAAWTLFAAAMFVWALGDLYYTIALENLAEVPIPSPADAGYLAFYLLTYPGLVLLFRSRVARLGRSLWVDGLIGALTVAAFTTTVLFKAVVLSTGGAPLSVATNLAYPIADLLLVAFVVGAIAMTGWSVRSAWAWLAAGLLAIAAMDALYLYGAAAGTYAAGDVIDIGWVLGALVIAVAAWLPAPEAEHAPATHWRTITLPLGFGLACVGLLVCDHFVPVNWLAVSLAGAAMVAILARLGLTFADNVTMLARTRSEALTDALTGLGNRRALVADLERALSGERAGGREHVLALFDLDGFKGYNDTFGHPAGDSLLERLGGNLAAFIGAHGGTAYRMGGDEFCILAVASGDVEHTVSEAAFALTERGEGFSVGCSFGSIVVPAEAASAETALRAVDQRMYAHKQDGRMSAGRESKDVLRRALIERDPELSRHGGEVAALAEAVARRLAMPDVEIEAVRLASELCDVGMVAIPDSIVGKPTALDEAETEFVRHHPIVGERILAAAPSLASVARLVRSSHERIDGAGYPDGLSGDAIPLGARIVFACSSYVRMRSERPHAHRATEAEALAELRRCAGSQFDRDVVEALCGVLGERVSRRGNGGPSPA